ncbi:MAG: DUF1566 domain-containing protein, partial [Treponema sp.]|nr:DUF1566 domain-containing protein [Treponema sp.]
QFSHSANDFISGIPRELYTGVNTLVANFVKGMSSEGGQVAQTTAPAAKEYKVGDFGPAGGWIFYDKGRVTNGWRYLEAAPSETEFTAPWGVYEKTVGGTAAGVGTGKRNTEVIANYLRGIRESGKAAQLCDSLVSDGFDDWFLPSKDELNLMYTNLKAKGKGEFGAGWYWSSSEDNNGDAWFQMFSDGSQANTYYYDKGYTFSVRAVRAF